MIFSKFFKQKWQHKDANIRITAIADLDHNNHEHQSVLRELLTNDNDDSVRKTALLKLGDFATFLQARNNSSNAVVTLANKQIEKSIFEDKLSRAEKQQVMDSVGKAPFFEKWFELEQDLEFAKKLYQLIAKPQNLVTLFNKKQDEDFQLAVIQDIADIVLLEKLAKKTKISAVKLVIEQKVNDLKAIAQKPITLAQHIQLLLSKYLALKDQTDYQVMLLKRESYDAEWLTLSDEMGCLDDTKKVEFITKHAAINEQLNKVFAQKEEVYQQQLIEQQVIEAKQQAKTHIEQTLATLTDVLSEAVFNNQLLDEQQYCAELEKIRQFIEQSALAPHEQNKYLSQTNKQLEKLKQLPIIAESVAEATHLVSGISQLAIPQTIEELNERYSQYQLWLANWGNVEKQSLSSLPASIVNAKQEIVNQWQAAIEPLHQEQKSLFGQAKKSIADLRRLINLGKYNACFGVHKKLLNIVDSLSEKQRFQLQRDIERINTKMNELSDWEHYIATPRKQALLAEIKKLVKTPLDNPNEQAKQVKQCRKAWNQLGHADEELEKTFNDEFNQACEQAFAPCRQYYAEQDKIREQHALNRQNIIKAVDDLAQEMNAEPVDWKNIDSKVNQLVDQWRNAGDVERSRYTLLKENFEKALAPIKERIYQFQQANAEKKSRLITSAEKLLTLDDNYEAIEQVKALQHVWKSVGFAGNRKDNQLWSKFRKVNDQLFEKRDQLKVEKNAEIDRFIADMSMKLDMLFKQVNEANNTAELTEINEQAEQRLAEIKAFKPVLKSLVTQADNLFQGVRQAKTNIQKQKSKQTWLDLFECFKQLQAIENTEQLKALKVYQKLQPSWQKRVLETLVNKSTGDRAAKTLEIEILAGIESPSSHAEQRLKMQVQLMQSQMQSGGQFDKTVHLQQWLALGALSKNDASLIERIKPVYC